MRIFVLLQHYRDDRSEVVAASADFDSIRTAYWQAVDSMYCGMLGHPNTVTQALYSSYTHRQLKERARRCFELTDNGK